MRKGSPSVSDDALADDPVEEVDGGPLLVQGPTPLGQGPVAGDSERHPLVGGGDEPKEELWTDVIKSVVRAPFVFCCSSARCAGPSERRPGFPGETVGVATQATVGAAVVRGDRRENWTGVAEWAR